MAVLFLLLAFLVVVVLAAIGLENTDASTATLFDRSFGQLTEGQLLIVAAGLGFLLALFLFLAFGASRTRRARRKELKYRRRDAESRVDELERENARLQHELANTREKLDGVDRNRADAVAERDRAEAAVDRVRATNRDRADAAAEPHRTGATAIDDRPQAEGRATAPPPEPASVRRERLDDRTGAPLASDEHARAADDEEARRR
jgi:hypothetical protein